MICYGPVIIPHFVSVDMCQLPDGTRPSDGLLHSLEVMKICLLISGRFIFLLARLVKIIFGTSKVFTHVCSVSKHMQALWYKVGPRQVIHLVYGVHNCSL